MRYGVQIEFEITCCQGACPVIFVRLQSRTSLPRYLEGWCCTTLSALTFLGNGPPSPPHDPCPTVERPTMQAVICHLKPVRPSLRSPSGPSDIHTSPRLAGWAVNWCTAVACCRSITLQPTPFESSSSVTAALSYTARARYTLHLDGRFQSRPQISKLGCLSN